MGLLHKAEVLERSKGALLSAGQALRNVVDNCCKIFILFEGLNFTRVAKREIVNDVAL